MNLKNIVLSLVVLAGIGLSGCGSSQLKKDVAPLADAMCRFIEVQNQLRAAVDTGDSIAIHKYTAEKHKMTIEMSVLNEEFQEKYADQISDKEFGNRFRLEMNKAMIDCPHLADEDRERMKAEIREGSN